MKITETREHDVTDSELREAIELRHSDCFTAMAFCRGLEGGKLEVPWKLVEMFSPVELIQEAQKRGLDMSEWRPAIHRDNPLLVETDLYRAVMEHLETMDPTPAPMGKGGE